MLIGKRSLLADKGVQNISALDERADELQRQGRTVMYVAVDQQFAGLLAVSDPIKPSTLEAVRSLHDLGMRIIMGSPVTKWDAGERLRGMRPAGVRDAAVPARSGMGVRTS